mmetsp:Transcript_11472/g.32291  ORF Transcript_11472/g.32291 Transcript_11472/m.32291 type:complete len:699 (-) Transcript_11472:78-2174(-)
MSVEEAPAGDAAAGISEPQNSKAAAGAGAEEVKTACPLTPTAPRGAKSGRPHPKCELDAFWKEFFQGLVEDKAFVDKEKLDGCVAAAVEVERMARKLLADAASAGFSNVKLGYAMSAKLFPTVTRTSQLDAVSPRRGPPHHRLSVDFSDFPEDTASSTCEQSDAYVNTTKYAYFMERRAPQPQAVTSTPMPPATPQRKQSLEALRRCQTVPVQLGTSSPSRAAAGPGLFICKHFPGGPEQIYSMDIQVGEGTFGKVRKAVHQQTGQVHVVKSIPKKLIPEAELWAEINMMKCLDHPHIMRLYYTFEDVQHVHIASEMCAGGELFDAILAAEVLTESIAAKLFKQCMSSVAYLHFSNICHRDLKPENFLLSRKGDLTQVKVKLIDFGTAKRFDMGPMTTKVCTVNYVAPEVLKRSSDPYTEKIDVWSCGVMLYVMLSGNSPWNHTEDREVLKLVKKGKYAFKPDSIWNKVSDSAQQLIRRMMCMKAPERYTASEALHDNWFSEKLDCEETVQIDEEVLAQMRSFVGNNKLKKVALQVIARSISDDSIDKLRQIFLEFDKDMSGSLTMEEVESALRALNAPESVVVEMQRILAQMDMDGSGDINWTEFLASTMKTQQYLQEEVCRAAFHMMDQDGDGIITRPDIVNLLLNEDRKQEAGLLGMGVEQADKILESVDVNGDGQLTFEEFMQMMNDSSGRQAK